MKIDPIEFVKQMDKKIIGQDRAKKTLGIALRNRWRRSMLSEADRSIVIPKNILMIGDTGVGKTALVKAMADAIDAPLLKVEATKYTQTGYVGNNIREIISDLAELAERKLNKGKKSLKGIPSGETDRNPFVFLNMLMKNQTNKKDFRIERSFDNKRTRVYRLVLSTLKKEFYQIVKSVGYTGKENLVFSNSSGFYTEKDLEFIVANKTKGLTENLNFTTLGTRDPWFLHKGYVPRKLLRRFKGKNKQKREDELSLKLAEKSRESKLIVALADYLNSKEDKYIDAFIETLPNESVNTDNKKWLKRHKSKLIDDDGFLNQIRQESNTSIVNESKSLEHKEIIEVVHKKGIIFIDEIDKLIDKSNQKDNIGKLGVQRDLLALLDGTEVETPYGKVHTENIMFITAGAFHLDGVNDLMPELLGRMPIRVKLEPMTLDVLRRILLNEDSSPITEHKKLLKVEDIELEVTEEAIEEMARTANKINQFYNNTGARTLHTVVNGVLESISFNPDIKDRKGVMKIDKEYVKEELKGLMKEYNQGLLSDMARNMYM